MKIPIACCVSALMLMLLVPLVDVSAGGCDGLGERRKEAEAMICVTVVDAEGKPIAGAPVKGYF